MRTTALTTLAQHSSLTLPRDSRNRREVRKETKLEDKFAHGEQAWKAHTLVVYSFICLYFLALLFSPPQAEATCWTETISVPFLPKKEVKICDSEHPLEDLIREGGHAISEFSAEFYHLTEGCVANGQVTRARNIAGVPLRPVQKHYLRPYFGDLVDRVSVRYGADLNDRIYGGDSAAQTYGYDIFVADPYSVLDTEQIVTIAHELQHSRQYEKAGEDLYGFCHDYIKGFIEGLVTNGASLSGP